MYATQDFARVAIACLLTAAMLSAAGADSEATAYRDHRPQATHRMDAQDEGVVLRHGDGPADCDRYGARDVYVFEAEGIYYLHYDAAGPLGWLCSLATSADLRLWENKGPVLDLGAPGSEDAKSASYGVTYREGDVWHMFYLGTPNTSPAPDRVPSFPYLTMKAKSDAPGGPWKKQSEVVPFRPMPGTYYAMVASPGQTVRQGDSYLQFFSSTLDKGGVKRTLGIARTQDLDGPWTVDPEPALPVEEQIENSSLYFEEANQHWFLFTNHVGIAEHEYTDAIWVYWSQDLDHWDPRNKAIVLDAKNCAWSKRVVGLPSTIRVGDRLAILYDGLAEEGIGHMHRDVGLAWLDLPLTPPEDPKVP